MLKDNINKIVLKKDMTIGYHFDFKKGDSIFYKDGIYSEAFQEWSIILFQKIGEDFLEIGTIRTSSLRDAIFLNN